jgi:cysteine synthase A
LRWNTATAQSFPATRLGCRGYRVWGAGFIPAILGRDVIDEIVCVGDVAASRVQERLAREEGILVGPSSGANVHAAIQIAAT